MTITPAVACSGYDSITGPVNQTDTCCPTRSSVTPTTPLPRRDTRVLSVILTPALAAPCGSLGFSSTTIVGRAIAVTCPTIDGVVRGMADAASVTDGSVTAGEHPALIRELKSSVLTRWACIFVIYILFQLVSWRPPQGSETNAPYLSTPVRCHRQRSGCLPHCLLFYDRPFSTNPDHR